MRVRRYSTDDPELVDFLVRHHGLKLKEKVPKSILLCDAHFTLEGQRLGRIHNPMKYLLKESCGPRLTDSFKLNKPRRRTSAATMLSWLRDRALHGQRLHVLLKKKIKSRCEAKMQSLKKKISARRAWMAQIDETRSRLRPREDDVPALKKRIGKLQDELQEQREAALGLEKRCRDLVGALARSEKIVEELRSSVQDANAEPWTQEIGPSSFSLMTVNGLCQFGLFPILTGLKNEIEYMSLIGSKLNRYHSLLSRSTSKFSRADIGVWYFVHYRAGMEMNTIAKLAKVDQAYVSRMIEEVGPEILRSINESLNQVRLRTPRELLDAMSDKQRTKYPGFIMLAVDATPVPVSAHGPGVEARPFYAPKYSKHVACWTALVDSAGHVLCVTDPEKGSVNDKTAWDGSTFRRRLEAHYGEFCTIDSIAYKYSIMGDKAYPAAKSPAGWYWHCTMTAAKKKAKATAVNGDRLVCDLNVAAFRAVVERTFGNSKRWAFLSAEPLPWCGRSKNILSTMIAIAASLHNYRLDEFLKSCASIQTSGAPT